MIFKKNSLKVACMIYLCIVEVLEWRAAGGEGEELASWQPFEQPVTQSSGF
jgi:hypothetical protein